MNRRGFMTRLGAALSIPALPLGAIAAPSVATTAAVPNAARFWAIYMSQLHGHCTPAVLAKMTSLDVGQAQGYLSRLVSDGVIKPNPFASNALGKQGKDLVDKIDEGLEKLDDQLAKLDDADDKASADDAPDDAGPPQMGDETEPDQNLVDDS